MIPQAKPCNQKITAKRIKECEKTADIQRVIGAGHLSNQLFKNNTVLPRSNRLIKVLNRGRSYDLLKKRPTCLERPGMQTRHYQY